jgi:hypothetical protein
MDGSRTDTIIDCVTRELKRRKEEIEKDRTLRSLTVKVILSDRDGQPHKTSSLNSILHTSGPHEKRKPGYGCLRCDPGSPREVVEWLCLACPMQQKPIMLGQSGLTTVMF